MRAARLGTLAALVALVAGCMPTTMYHWRGYDDGLYRHYKNPQDREAWVETLRTVIVESEERGLKVPPGIFAEYGFALYEEGRFPDAIAWFERERAEWPESAVLMEKMIRNAQRQGALQPVPTAHGPAGAVQERTP